MRTQEQFENERHFGLQRFDNPQEAFEAMEDIWGEINGRASQHDPYTNLAILTDKSFPDMILGRAINMCCEKKAGLVDEATFKRSLGIGSKVNDYLCDFDFFLYSKKSQSYFTSRMSFKDDGVSKWKDRQWGYHEELAKIYDFDSIVEKAQKIVDGYSETDYDILYEAIQNDQTSPFVIMGI